MNKHTTEIPKFNVNTIMKCVVESFSAKKNVNIPKFSIVFLQNLDIPAACTVLDVALGRKLREELVKNVTVVFSYLEISSTESNFTVKRVAAASLKRTR